VWQFFPSQETFLPEAAKDSKAEKDPGIRVSLNASQVLFATYRQPKYGSELGTRNLAPSGYGPKALGDHQDEPKSAPAGSVNLRFRLPTNVARRHETFGTDLGRQLPERERGKGKGKGRGRKEFILGQVGASALHHTTQRLAQNRMDSVLSVVPGDLPQV
jgi:hypothetical protein